MKPPKSITNDQIITTIWQAISQADHLFLYHHNDPDGDCLGAKFGLGRLIEINFPNKKVFYLGDHYGLFSFLPTPQDHWHAIATNCLNNSLAIVLDADSKNRVLGSSDFDNYHFTYKMRIDHHNTVADIAYDYFWVDDRFAAAAEQVGYLAWKLQLKVDPLAANFIYLGINTDTDRLSFDRTTARTFRILAYLTDHGLNMPLVNQGLSLKTTNITKFMSYVWTNAIVDGYFIYCIISQAIIQKYQLNHLNSNHANLIANIYNTKAWAFFIELPDGSYRVRLRSNQVDLSTILSPFGLQSSYRFSVAMKFPAQQLQPVIAHISKVVNAT